MKTALKTYLPPLIEAPDRGHIVQFYQSPVQLSRQVVDFLTPGLENGEAAVLVCTPDHWQRFCDGLRGRGIDVDGLRQSGQLVVLDAADTLQLFMVNGRAEWILFWSTVGRRVRQQVEKYGKLRAYGEMVNLLWEDGFLSAALELEGLWGRLGKTYPFCLFCSYAVDLFDAQLYPDILSSICGTHSHAFDGHGDHAFDTVVQRALDEVLEPRESQRLRERVINAPSGNCRVSDSLQMLLQLSESLPSLATKVFTRARYYYDHAAS